MVKTASLYDNFCKTGNYVIDDVIILVQEKLPPVNVIKNLVTCFNR